MCLTYKPTEQNQFPGRSSLLIVGQKKKSKVKKNERRQKFEVSCSLTNSLHTYTKHIPYWKPILYLLFTCIILITKPAWWNTWLHLTDTDTMAQTSAKSHSCKEQSRNLHQAFWCAVLASLLWSFCLHLHDPCLSRNASPSLPHTEKIEIKNFF